MATVQFTKLFSGLLASELRALQETGQERLLPAGTVVFREGDPGDGMYVVKRGCVQISALVSEQERRVLSRLGPGDFFGEMAVLDNEPRSATATAEEETVVFFIPREELLAVLEQSPQLLLALAREFSRRTREFNRHYLEEVLQAERLALVGRFARSIVHDFKNPLNIIGLAADLAGLPTATPEQRAEVRRRIRKQVDRLSNMINELLEFTRGTPGAVNLAPMDYAAFVNPLLTELQAEVAERGACLQCANQPPSAPVLLDPPRLTHVFYNLVHNALEAMPDGGLITCRFGLTDRDVLTELQDTGPGIAPEIAPRLFEPFATYGKAQGTGLGLSICKKIINDHRGRISARSEPGGGAVFAFTLPRAEAAAGVAG
jgi:signal transduction histidine kinase